MSLSLGTALGLGAGSAAVNFGGSLLGALFNSNQSEKAVERQIQGAKEIMDYEQSKYLSPKAQVDNLGAAGLNPAAAFGNTAPVNVGGSSAMPNAQPAMLQVGTQSLSDVASLLVGAAQAKKAGAEQPLIQNQAEGIALDNERKKMENDFMSRFGLQKSATELAQAYANLELAYTTKDEKEQNIALSKVLEAKENALREVNEKQRDILQKELDNKDTEIRLRNEKASEEIKTEKSQQSANYATAANQTSQANQNELFNKIYSDKRFQHSLVTQAVETGRQAVQQSKISKSQAEHMTYLVEQAAYANDMKEFTYWSGQVNQFVNTLGSAASQFYGAGALRELIHLRKGQQIPPVSVQGFKQ